jgi:hypothetical protein
MTIMRQQEEIGEKSLSYVVNLREEGYKFSGILYCDEVFFTDGGKKVCRLIACAVTDGWRSYPCAIMEVFSGSLHQLCKVHIMKEINRGAVEWRRKLEDEYIRPFKEVKEEVIKSFDEGERKEAEKIFNRTLEMESKKIKDKVEGVTQQMLDFLYAESKRETIEIFEGLKERVW